MVHGQPASVETSDKMNGGMELPDWLTQEGEVPALGLQQSPSQRTRLCKHAGSGPDGLSHTDVKGSCKNVPSVCTAGSQALLAPFIGILGGGGARACCCLPELGPPCRTGGSPDWECLVPRFSSAMMSLEIWSDVSMSLTRVSNWAGVLPCKPRRLGIWALGPLDSGA